MRQAFAALVIVTAPVLASAQDVEAFRSFSAMRPTIADEIVTASTLESPEGRYRVVDRRSTAQEHVYQVEGCQPTRVAPPLRARHPGQQHMRCRVVQISRTLECESCGPHAITFDDVIFARYTSRVTDDGDRPALDNWYARLSIGIRRVRLIIEEHRFIVHHWAVSDPNMAIIEAPIRRLR